MSGLVVSGDSTDAISSPSSCLSRLVSVAAVSSATSRFLSERWVASSGAFSTSLVSGTSTIRMSGGGGVTGGGGVCSGGGGGGTGTTSSGGGGNSATSSSSSFSASSGSGGGGTLGTGGSAA